MSNDTSKRRSSTITQGTQRAPNRAMLRAVGFSDADFDKPIVAVANGQSDITPCNAGLGELSRAAADALRNGGAKPQTFGTITISDGISMGTEGMKCSLVSREVIADSIETVCRGQSMDGLVAVGGCDKNMPASCKRRSTKAVDGSSTSPATQKSKEPSPRYFRSCAINMRSAITPAKTATTAAGGGSRSSSGSPASRREPAAQPDILALVPVLLLPSSTVFKTPHHGLQ